MVSRTAMAMAGAVAIGLWTTPPTPNATATVSGRITFNGNEPAAEQVDMSSEAFCRDAQGKIVARRRVKVGAQNGLADVVVHVKGVAAAGGAAPTEPVMLDQKNCLYDPAVLALRVGQPLIIRNSDGVLHNVHAFPKKSPAFNLGQPLAGMKSTRTFKAAEVGIPVKCDIHEWMDATIAVFDHGYFAVSGADGTFSIAGLPAGEYEIEAWHPTLGTRTQRIKVGTDALQIAFAFGS